jgi:hypothetical protein
MNHIIEYAHNLALSHLSSNSIAIDCTVGKGQDTLFLAKNAQFVYGFDIQYDAIKQTKLLCEQNKINNVQLIHDGHEKINQYIDHSFDVALFNLGYLPGGDKIITTTEKTTLEAIQHLLPLMSPSAIIILVIYIGHPAGKVEANALNKYLEQLSSKDYFATSHRDINHPKAPYVISIKKRQLH